MKIVFTDNIASIKAGHWNKIAGNSNPFIQHEFLQALEQHDCLQNWGWYPQHCLIYEDEVLIGACPAYIKDNSYGEFVFDWAWADAYQRSGLEYYPKLVTSIPFTPAQGPRFLVDNSRPDAHDIKKELINALITYAESNNFSTAHFLFCEGDDIQQLNNANLLRRFDYQFHWQNNHYSSFENFLDKLTSKRRKNIKRERRKVSESDVTTAMIAGNDLSEEQWLKTYDFYRSTFLKKSGAPTLTLDFFQAVANNLRVSLATHKQANNNKTVAAAICFEGKYTFYGRHWGCDEEFDSLHFELCYYSGIEYCIQNKLQTFEPGAQGEHKIWRGFMPVKTRSAHWIANPEFKTAIQDFLQREGAAMEDHSKLLLESSPFKQ